MRPLTIIGILAGGLLPLGGAGSASGSVLERVRERGYVTCGIDLTPGFSQIDAAGEASGFDIDFCRAVAAAVLGDGSAIEARRVNTATKFEALVNGEIDIAFGMTTWTLERDTSLGVVFPVVNYFDGQGFMAWSDDGPTVVTEMDGFSVCVQTGTTTETNTREFQQRHDLDIELVLLPSSEEKMNAFAQRQCQVVAGDRSELAIQRASRAIMPNQWQILPETISREPLGPVVVAGDPLWFGIVRWTVQTTLAAEVRGVTAANVMDYLDSEDSELRRLAGGDPDFGSALGLDPAWMQRVILEVGNYGEIFERNLGEYDIERGLNHLWREGGLMYPPPLR